MIPCDECTTAITKAMRMMMSNMKMPMSHKLEGSLRNLFIIIYRVSNNSSNNKLWKRDFKRKNCRDSTRISSHKRLNHVGFHFLKLRERGESIFECFFVLFFPKKKDAEDCRDCFHDGDEDIHG